MIEFNNSSIISVFINLTIEDACSIRSNILQLVDHRVKRYFAGSLFVNDWHPGFEKTRHILLKLKVNVLIITLHSWGHSPAPSAARTFQKGWPSPRRCQGAPEGFQYFVVVHKKRKGTNWLLWLTRPRASKEKNSKGNNWPSIQCFCGPQGVQHRCPCSTWQIKTWLQTQCSV